MSQEDFEKVQATATQLFDMMGFDVQLNCEIVSTGVMVRVEGDDAEQLTQRKGELASSIRFLLNRMGRRAWPEAGRVQLSCGDDGTERDEELVELTREVIQQVRTSGKEKKLHPMNSYERRLVHLEVREIEGIDSRSEGDGELRQVVIFPIDAIGEDEDEDVSAAFDPEDGDEMGASLAASVDPVPAGDADADDASDVDGDADGDADGEETETAGI